MKRLLLVLVACGGAEISPPPPKDPTPVASASAPPMASVVPTAISSAKPVVLPAQKPMDELQLTAVKASSDAINAHDTTKYNLLFTPNAIHREAAAREVVGRTGIARRMQLLFDAFPDFKFSFDRFWRKDNIAVATWRWTGTDKGGFMGKKPTSRKAGLQGVTVGFFNTDGAMREVHVYEDGQNVLYQLDAAKAAAARPPPVDSTAALEMTSAGPDEDKNTSVAKAFFDALEAKKEGESAALFSDDATVDDFAIAAKPGKGPNAWKALLKSFTATFGASASQLPLYNLMAVGDWVIAESTLKGTMSGVPMSLHCAYLMQLKDGKIIRLSMFSNTLELTGQIGDKGLRKG